MARFSTTPPPPPATPTPAGTVGNSGGVAMAASMGKATQFTLGALFVGVFQVLGKAWQVIGEIFDQILKGGPIKTPDIKWNRTAPTPAAPSHDMAHSIPSYDAMRMDERLKSLEGWRTNSEPRLK